jgi:hypothetical protein
VRRASIHGDFTGDVFGYFIGFFFWPLKALVGAACGKKRNKNDSDAFFYHITGLKSDN